MPVDLVVQVDGVNLRSSLAAADSGSEARGRGQSERAFHLTDCVEVDAEVDGIHSSWER